MSERSRYAAPAAVTDNASRAQKEIIIDLIVPIYIHGFRTYGYRECPASVYNKWNHAVDALRKHNLYTEVKRIPKQRWKNALQNVRMKPQLEAARARAATRTYAPGGRGMQQLKRKFHARAGT